MPEIKNKAQSNIIIGNIIILMMSFFFFPILSPGLTVLLGIFVLLFSNNKLENFNENLKYIFLFSAYFGIHLVGMIYTQNTIAGWINVVLKLSFLAFPLIFGVMQKDFIRQKQLVFLLGAFIVITTSSILFSLFHATYEYFIHSDKQAFFYARLSYLLHPSYYALYVNFALMAVLCRLLITRKLEKNSSKIIYWLFIPFYIVFLILLESKAGLLGLISVIILTLIYLIFFERKYKSAISLALVSLIATGITITLFPQTTSRVNQVVESMDKEENASNHSATAARIYLWEAAFRSFAEKPVLGHGTGDVKEELMNQYEIQKNTRAIEMNYNSHNQYLQTMVATGIFGLMSLFLLVGFPIFFGLKRKILFYFLLSFLMAINLIVESMFERQAGVMFYAFFNSLLFFFYKYNDDNPEVLH